MVEIEFDESRQEIQQPHGDVDVEISDGTGIRRR